MKTPDGPVPNEAYRVLHGGATELRALKDWFIANSITFAYAKFYVPCSNGPDGPYYGGPGVPLTKAFSHEQISLVRLHGDFTPMQMIEQAWVAISRTAAHPVIDILHEML